MRAYLTRASAILAVILLAVGCRKQDGADGTSPVKKPVPLVKAVPAKAESLVQWFETTGDVVAANPVGIRATVDGPVLFCPWREGDTVPAGGKLIEIDRPVYREEVRGTEAALAVARARLADLKAGARPEEIAQAKEAVTQLEECTGFAESDMKRIDQMVKSGSLPGETLDKARVTYVKCRTQLVAAQEKLGMLQAGPTVTAVAVQEALVKEAEARVERAKATLAECVLTAPFDSQITRVYVRPGDLATAKAPLLDLIEKDALVVRFSLPEAQSTAVHTDTPVTLAFDALAGRNVESRILRVYPESDPATRTRLAEAAVPPGLGVVPGMFARVRVAVRTLTDVVVVPDSALVVLPNGETVAFVIVDGKAVRRKLRTAMEAGGRVVVETGIQPGEQVVVQGNEALKDGAPVQIAGQKKDGSAPGNVAGVGVGDRPEGTAKEGSSR